MPQLAVTHVTTYDYSKDVELGPHRMMLRPRESPHLHLVEHELHVEPTADVEWSQDVSGNAVAEATFGQPTRRLRIASRAVIDLEAPRWPVFPIAASAASYPFLYSAEDWTDLGALAGPQYADPTGRLAGWAGAFVMAHPTDTLSLLKDLAEGVAMETVYRSREVEGTQGPLETLDLGSGSCRDLAVLFAEAARTLGFGARLVSGYLHDPRRQLTGSTGEGSTHAWVEIYLPGAGWITFDPTNRALGSADLVPVAVGRRMEQISPVIGHFYGPRDASSEMRIEVNIKGQ
ncbi:transglutaminase family protein [Roseibacterium sp. SDUM158017]|uniref:transglutaminase family protein n=1 Tax=Roseicyclus salinarum TaxID=3036773 RepID=UPI00241535D6|nr:transglutaminase family protein [Roseibacterium sp. SDUM158017]MDG4648741.1 transglutaminase family protein [Roseibacterium sp. SDUM158017]